MLAADFVSKEVHATLLNCLSALRKAVSLNSEVLCCLARQWVQDFTFQGHPRTVPLKATLKQVLAGCSSVYYSNMSSRVARSNGTNPTFPEVTAFWRMSVASDDDADTAGMPGRIQIHAEAWGLKKLLSLAIRRMKEVSQFRDSLLHLYILFHCACWECVRQYRICPC